MYGNSMMLLLDAIMLKANTAPNSFMLHHVHRAPDHSHMISPWQHIMSMRIVW